MNQILMIEDEPRISAFVSKGLKAEGFATTVATTGREGLVLALTGGFELVILDLGLPDIDGFEVLQRIRAQDQELPVIILTARTSADDTVTGLTSGADDYMPKPFRFAELVARVRLRLRPDPQTPGPAQDTVLRHADLEMDPVRHTVTIGGSEVDLSAREFSLAETFLRHPGQALSREQLLSRVWGYDFDPGSNVVDVYVRYLRNKLGASRIVTVRGVGYRLVDEKDYAPED
ncbi:MULTISPECIES: response regulator transcription factor [Micrococcus]|uniref:DNA-binding response regulator, OmpR family, contains REC and winged-helix (WHTH) domain n=1 Tax=Micrococcus terreus TaxID=574650 RepID=A0A1I7ME89_9MICC|nr:response regulator transcription factor [Micrococcus terreus]MDK7700479.1 response regulator transcription factor [Micrococcus terreus]WOO98796.1 response regulator transcription factor [Micrococcus terreus]SFV20253.1 DNA-binding response regulator, OmpR family, contains REC and winged-helix (wHTH) domain [Micrococcus terreus]